MLIFFMAGGQGCEQDRGTQNTEEMAEQLSFTYATVSLQAIYAPV